MSDAWDYVEQNLQHNKKVCQDQTEVKIQSKGQTKIRVSHDN